ncbi:hypothetical protein PVK06_002619 [Gossypium arboreum]|uniref:RNase H type-1 domain-containing protein n=1 Tax=Gossypium arboreum TaxID=29729 RepID=A0ABR0R570_GOSAR|nr:hypothetical protein PVK06_002619 [Gossypium arboreum]
MMKTRGCGTLVAKPELASKLWAHKPKLPTKLIFAFGLWEIWLHRNDSVLNPGTIQKDIALCAINGAAEFFAVPGATKKIPLPICVAISWKPPADSSSIGNLGIGGAETIIRDHNGPWIISSHCHFPFATNIETELWAVRDRLTLARRLDLRHLDTEDDATLIIHFMSNNSFSNPILFPLIDKCKMLLYYDF